MDPKSDKASRQQGSIQGLVGSCAILALALIPAAAIVASICARRFETPVILSAAVAAGICWLAGSLALLSTFFGQRMQLPVQGVLLGMLFRMGLPLVTGAALHKAGGPLAEAGVFSMVVGVYLFALMVETVLSLRMVPATGSAAKAA